MSYVHRVEVNHWIMSDAYLQAWVMLMSAPEIDGGGGRVIFYLKKKYNSIIKARPHNWIYGVISDI